MILHSKQGNKTFLYLSTCPVIGTVHLSKTNYES